MNKTMKNFQLRFLGSYVGESKSLYLQWQLNSGKKSKSHLKKSQLQHF